MIHVSGIYENGQIRLLTPIYKTKAKVIVTVIEDENEQEMASPSNRVPGLHKGSYFMADDFDAPLPDAFWLGEE